MKLGQMDREVEEREVGKVKEEATVAVVINDVNIWEGFVPILS